MELLAESPLNGYDKLRMTQSPSLSFFGLVSNNEDLALFPKGFFLKGPRMNPQLISSNKYALTAPAFSLAPFWFARRFCIVQSLHIEQSPTKCTS